MYRRFKDRFGTAGVVLGVIAIVLAIGGSAIAASGLNGKQKKEVKSIAKSFQGTGPAGAAGAAGTNGTNGKDGTAGAPGKDGEDGQDGAAGKSVVVGTTSAGCPGSNPAGGVTVEVEGNSASKKTACNGKEGSPWTAGGTLPVGSTETGVYSTPSVSTPLGPVGSMNNGEGASVPVSFSIPTATAPTFVFVPGVAGAALGEGEFGADAGAGCPGVTAAGIPQAASGKFCVYGFAANFGVAYPSADVGTNDPSSPFGSPAVMPSGTILVVDCINPASEPEEEACFSKGLWAVTG